MYRKTYTPGELAQILAQHRLWRETDGARGARAYLEGADMKYANLTGAYLEGANLAYAYLTDAYLTGANLTGANLAGADMKYANLTGANLTGANLTGACLRGADLTGANLRSADLTRANLENARLRDADMADQQIPVIDQLDVKVLAAIEADPKHFNMSTWHSFRDPAQASKVVGDCAADIGAEKALELGNACGTTHCRAGFAIHLAGKAGYELEANLGPQVAGTLIYLKSTGRVPDFTCSNNEALEDIRKCAAKQLAAANQEVR